MTDKESVIDELFGAIAGIFLFYGISSEEGAGRIITDLLKRTEEQLRVAKQALEPFEDEYFNGLDTTVIAELAKKSIRLSTENRRLEDALDEIEGKIKEINGSDVLTFPDLSLQENAKAIMRQCNKGYREILDIISKAKGGEE